MREIAQLLRNNRSNKSVSTCFLFTGTYDLASGTMKSVREQHIVSAEKDLQFEFTPNTEDAVGTCKSRIN